MAESSSAPDASPKPGEPSLDLLEHSGSRLHRPMAHSGEKTRLVAILTTAGILFAFVGVVLLWGTGWALVVLGALVIAVAVAAYHTLEDE